MAKADLLLHKVQGDLGLVEEAKILGERMSAL